MEELHKVAQAYYHNGSPHAQHLIEQFFRTLDTNNDGMIQFNEFISLLNREGYLCPQMNHYLFRALDSNQNGVLDFNEFLTFYYVIKTRTAFCCRCGRLLNGMYFTCVTCFDCPWLRTFDLCADCYNVPDWKPHHSHTNFVDTTLLLRARRNCHTPSSSHAVEEFMQPTGDFQQTQVNNQQYRPDARLINVNQDVLRALEIALAAGAIGVAAFCSIM